MCGVAVSVQSGTKWWRGSRDDVMEVCLALFLDLFLFFFFVSFFLDQDLERGSVI